MSLRAILNSMVNLQKGHPMLYTRHHFNVYNDDLYRTLDVLFEDSPFYSKPPSQICQVIEEGSKQNKPCQGVFIFENVTYYGCTTTGSKTGQPWCSTKVNPITLEHVSDGEFFGYCDVFRTNNCISADVGQLEHDKMRVLHEGKHYSSNYFNFLVKRKKLKKILLCG